MLTRHMKGGEEERGREGERERWREGEREERWREGERGEVGERHSHTFLSVFH